MKAFGLLSIILMGVGGCYMEPFSEPIAITPGTNMGTNVVPMPATYVVPSAEATARAVEGVATSQPATVVVVDEKAREQIWKEAQANILKKYPLLQDAKLNEYLVLVGSLVSINTAKEIDYTFALLNSESPFACSVGPKTIYVSKGLLMQMEDESELAGVLAREMSNLAAGRALKAAGVPVAGATSMPANAKTVAADAKQVAQYTANLTDTLLRTGMGVELEQQADVEGARIAAGARYAPDGYLHLLTRQKGSWERIKTLDATCAILAKAFPMADVRLPARFESYVRSPKQ